jgi:hypothetical protein
MSRRRSRTSRGHSRGRPGLPGQLGPPLPPCGGIKRPHDPLIVHFEARAELYPEPNRLRVA